MFRAFEKNGGLIGGVLFPVNWEKKKHRINQTRFSMNSYYRNGKHNRLNEEWIWEKINLADPFHDFLKFYKMHESSLTSYSPTFYEFTNWIMELVLLGLLTALKRLFVGHNKTVKKYIWPPTFLRQSNVFLNRFPSNQIHAARAPVRIWINLMEWLDLNHEVSNEWPKNVEMGQREKYCAEMEENDLILAAQKKWQQISRLELE